MPQLVFLPGTMCDARLFAPQIQQLASTDWQVSCLNVGVPATSLQAMARNMLATLPEPVAIVGFSFGGQLALEMLHAQPSCLTHLALLSSSTCTYTQRAREQHDADKQDCAKLGLEQFIREEMMPRYCHPRNAGNQQLADTIVRMALDSGITTWHRQIDLLATRQHHDACLTRASIPILIGCGVADRITPPAKSQELAQLASNARLVEFSACGHLATLENPQAVTHELVRLLAQNQ